MSKLKIYSTFDAKLKTFTHMFTTSHTGQALRMWEQECNDPKSMLSKYPTDFVLYEVGVFDQDKGMIEPHSPIHQVATALDYKKPSAPELVQ